MTDNPKSNPPVGLIGMLCVAVLGALILSYATIVIVVQIHANTARVKFEACVVNAKTAHQIRVCQGRNEP